MWIECAEWQIGQSLRVVDCLFIYLSKHCPEASAREHCDNKNRQQQQQQQQNAKTFAKANEQIRRELKPIPNIIFIAHNLISLSIKRNCTMAKLTGRHSLLPLCLSVDVASSLALSLSRLRRIALFSSAPYFHVPWKKNYTNILCI